jgi:hypothetical protein
MIVGLALVASAAPWAAEAATPLEQDLGAGPWKFATGDDLAYADPALPDGSWSSIATGADWRGQGHANYFGYAWYRRHFTIDPAVAAMPHTSLSIAHNDSHSYAFINGHFLGSSFREGLVADIPREWLNLGGNNVLAVRSVCGGHEIVGYEGCGLTGAVVLRGSSSDRAAIPVKVSTDQLGNVSAPGTPLNINVRVINSTIAPMALTVRAIVREHYSQTTAMDSSAPLALATGQTGTAAIPFTSTVRGPYDLTVTVSDAAGQISSTPLGIGVADNPGSRDERFGSNSVQDDYISASLGDLGNAALNLAKRVGATWNREHLVPWMHVQQEPGLWNWGMYDALQEASQDTGVKLLWNVHYTPYWAFNMPAPSAASSILAGLQHPPTTDHYPDWANFFATAATRYPGSAWEIGNEPDGQVAHYVTPRYGCHDELEFLDLLRQSATAIRAADATAQVVLGGMQGADQTAPRENACFPDRIFDMPKYSFFYRLMEAGAADWFDVTNIHIYRDPNPSEEFWPANRMQATNDILDEFGIRDRELWNTETNYNAASDPNIEKVRQFMPRNTIELLAAGVDRVFPFYTVDYPDDPVPWGMWDDRGQPRPAAFSYLTLTRLAAGLDQVATTTVGGVPGYRFSAVGRTDSVIALWDDAGASVVVPAGMSAFDDFGNPIASAGASITLGPTVTYLVSA